MGNALITQYPFKILNFTNSIGKTLYTENNDTIALQYYLTDDAQVTVFIVNQNNELVKKIVNSQNKNKNIDYYEIWNCKNELNEFVQTGTYTFTIKAVNNWGTRSASGEITVVNQ